MIISRIRINRKAGIALLLIIITVAIAIGFYMHNKQSKQDNEEINNIAIKSLTPEIISRLQSYPYYEKRPLYGFRQMIEQKLDSAKWIESTFFNYIVKFQDNEKFFTNEELTYTAWNNHFVIRGVYQVKSADGSITEQDVEYEYRLGAWNDDRTEVKLIYEGMRTLSGQKAVRSDVK